MANFTLLNRIQRRSGYTQCIQINRLCQKLMNHSDKYRYFIFLMLLGLQLLVSSVFAAEKVLDLSQTKQIPISLTEYFAVLEDPSLLLTHTDVQKADIAARFKTDFAAAEAINLGFSDSAYWLRLRLRNSSDYPLERLLEIHHSLLSNVQFYQPMPDGTYQSITTGSALPFTTRPYANRYFVFPVTLPAHADQVIYLRIQATDAIIIPARLWESQAFHRYERNDYLVQAWYFGIATAMILFNLLLFIALRDMVYLWYVSFVSLMALVIATQNGLSKEFLLPNTLLWSDTSSFIVNSLMGVAWLLFVRRMLNTQAVVPKLDQLLKALIGIYLLTIVGFSVSLETFIQPALLLYLATIILVIGIGFFCAFKRQRSAYFFVAASLLLCFSTAVAVLGIWGILPSNALIFNAMQTGATLETLLLAFALADRFNEIRQQKENAQRDVLLAQQHLVEHLQSSERLLEARVEERTAELHILNQKLEALSMTDGLTGIANRRHFDEVLASEWNRALRQGQSLALALLDVDWFKKYNDHYGHQAGDDCLRHVASTLAATVCRTGDLVARYGGEEFVFIAPATDADNALNMARKVCEALQAQALPHTLSDFSCVTVSIGVAVIIPNKDDSPEMLLKAADDALYLAKKQGRNQAVLANL
jgi:diguanylate cyclase (GGDEF)-like protein